MHGIEKRYSEVSGVKTDWGGFFDAFADEVDAAVPADMLVNDGGLHIAVWAMDDVESHLAEFFLAVAEFGYDYCNAGASKRGGGEQVNNSWCTVPA